MEKKEKCSKDCQGCHSQATCALVEKISSLIEEVEQFHRLKEHLLIVLATRQRRFTLESTDPEVRDILIMLDRILFPEVNPILGPKEK